MGVTNKRQVPERTRRNKDSTEDQLLSSNSDTRQDGNGKKKFVKTEVKPFSMTIR